MKTKYRRLFAYIIDIIIVGIISALFIGIPSVNPYLEQYEEASNALLEVYNGTLTTNNVNVLEAQYNFLYYSFYVSVILLVVKVIYFVIFQYFNKGQTIGKAIYKIKIESNKKKLKIYQVLLSSLVGANILLSGLNLICLRLLNMNDYYSASNILSSLEMLMFTAVVLMILIRKDEKGLQDVISGTKVVRVEKE